jgi:environmental stress-induced protein Ves
MKITTFYGNTQEQSSWSGGTTTELFIYPDGATNTEQNFDFRISTADVISATSNFTAFPGYHRRLLVLRGGIELTHKDQYTKMLTELEQDAFSGDWETSAIGRCMDFNLICSPKAKGKMKAHQLEKGARVEIQRDDSFLFIYAVIGSIDVIIDEKTYSLGSTDFLIIREPDNVEIEIYTQVASLFVETRVNY